MKSIDQAYEYLTEYSLAFADGRPWDLIHVDFSIYFKMATADHFLIYKGNKINVGGFENNSDAIWTGLDATIFIRDYMVKVTGDRIWGLKFTLYPNGKFEIEYDYNKPKDYEETSEVITGDEISQAFLR